MGKAGRKPKGPGPSKGCRALVRWIEATGQTRTAVCEMFGWSKSRLSRYTTGSRLPNSHSMHKMEILCKIPMAHWLEN